MLKHVTDEQRSQPGCSGGGLGQSLDCRSRNACRQAPPPQIPASGTTALGSCLGL